MPTNRTPIARNPLVPITPRALEAFGHMKRLARMCTCPPPRYPDYVEDCDACQQWWEWHSVLREEVKAPPWEWPVVVEPDDDDDDGNDSDDPHFAWRRVVRQRYRILDAALRASKSD